MRRDGYSVERLGPHRNLASAEHMPLRVLREGCCVKGVIAFPRQEQGEGAGVATALHV
jgi:hypothetical protein